MTRAIRHRRHHSSGGYALAEVVAERRHGYLAAQLLSFAVFVLLAIPALYLAKSAVGIDLLPGPSPLHDWLYPLLRR